MRIAYQIGFFILSALLIKSAEAQYYFKDIISIRQNNEDMSEYKMTNIHQINILSFEENGEPSKHFFCTKKLSKDYKKSSLYTKTGIAGKSILVTTYNNNLQVIRTYDSSEFSINESKFYYDKKDRLIKVSSSSKSADDDYLNLIAEEHIYDYADEETVPNRLMRIKNNNDTTFILFSIDEHHNISVEKDTKTAAKYYYYYNDANLLTDIVHTNEYNENLIADYIFEYDSKRRIVRQTSTEEGSSNYLIWKYEYEGNLRKKEKVYTKTGVFIGSIEYEYK